MKSLTQREIRLLVNSLDKYIDYLYYETLPLYDDKPFDDPHRKFWNTELKDAQALKKRLEE